MKRESIKEGVLKQGILSKKGNIVKNWKSRFFVLTENDLSYYSHEKDKIKVKKGSIQMKDIITAHVLQDDLTYFSIVTQSRTYKIHADTNIEASLWIDAILSRASIANDTSEEPQKPNQEIQFAAFSTSFSSSSDDAEPAKLPKFSETIAENSETPAKPSGDPIGKSKVDSETPEIPSQTKFDKKTDYAILLKLFEDDKVLDSSDEKDLVNKRAIVKLYRETGIAIKDLRTTVSSQTLKLNQLESVMRDMKLFLKSRLEEEANHRKILQEQNQLLVSQVEEMQETIKNLMTSSR